jgi:cation diffusion facilitator CzcD-associated flavoprotein CzcO
LSGNVQNRFLKIEKSTTGEIFDEKADIVIACRGNLNDLAWPHIAGLDTFEGEKMHSAAWNNRLLSANI